MAEAKSDVASRKTSEKLSMSVDQIRTMVQELVRALPRDPPAPPREDEGSFAKDIQNFKRKLPTFVIGQQPLCGYTSCIPTYSSLAILNSYIVGIQVFILWRKVSDCRSTEYI